MAKDPATLWYWNDWISGTMTLSRHLKGCYMDLLGAQFNSGHLSEAEIRTILGSDFGQAWPTLQKKFVQDDNGLYYNVKAEETKNKRASYTASRRVNGGSHMGGHMENEIENRKLKFETEARGYAGEFSPAMIDAFTSYWLEMNKSGTKFRYEDQKYFDMKKRLTTWKSRDKGAFTGGPKTMHHMTVAEKDEQEIKAKYGK